MKRGNPAIFTLLFILATFVVSCGNKDENKKDGIILPPSEVQNYKYEKPSAETIRLMTYNSFYCKSNTGSPAFNATNTKNFADVIRSLSPDIIAIQELDSGAVGRDKRFLLKEIKEATGIDYQIVFGQAAQYDGGTIGNGILIKKAFAIQGIKKISLPGKEARLLVVVELPEFVFMATHLDLDNNNRIASAAIINDFAKKYNKPLFLAGDLNDSPAWDKEKSAFPTLYERFESISAADGSLPNDAGTTIDYILLDKSNKQLVAKQGSNVVKQLYIDTQVVDIKTVSDHYPVFVDLKIIKN